MILAGKKTDRELVLRTANDIAGQGNRVTRAAAAPKFFFIKEFEDPGAGEVFMAVTPASSEAPQPTAPSGFPAYWTHLWRRTLLSEEQEQHCFRKLNYLKYLLAKAAKNPNAFLSPPDYQEDMKALRMSIARTRNFLVESNMRLVVSIAKRHDTSAEDTFDELVSVGNEALIRAVDLFDFRRGVRFSTYAYQAIERKMFGLYRRSQRQINRCSSLDDDALRQVAGDAGACDRAVLEATEAGNQVANLLEQLDDRDKHIVKARFGIGRAQSGVAFHVIAKEIRLSTTRTIQLFNRSIEKMRSVRKQ